MVGRGGGGKRDIHEGSISQTKGHIQELAQAITMIAKSYNLTAPYTVPQFWHGVLLHYTYHHDGDTVIISDHDRSIVYEYDYSSATWKPQTNMSNCSHCDEAGEGGMMEDHNGEGGGE